MAQKICPVRQTVNELSQRIGSGRIRDPRERRICEQILVLMDEIASGAAGKNHLQAVGTLLDEYLDKKGSEQTLQNGQALKAMVREHWEVYQSHIDTRNCPSHDCGKLAPSPCQTACPAGIDIPTYLTLIARGDDSGAIEVIRRDNPFPWVCGLICTRPCEMMCVRSRIDSPISIKFLKAFAAERAMSVGAYQNPEKKPFNGKKVCVIGAGPGGLTAAYYLALMGYGVKVIEALPVAGGMLMVGIPRYRLPREVIDREVAMIEDLGVDIVYNTRFGRDIGFQELKDQGFEAFFIAIGAHRALGLGIKGEKEFSKVLEAVHFLKKVALGDHHAPGKSVVVIGGGNVAIDAARTSLRLGARKVTLAYRRSRDQMPADVEEVEQAQEEGIEFSFLTIPAKILGEGDRITGLSCIKAELIQQEGSNRLVPVPVEGKEFIIEADAVISAIGQIVNDQGMEAFDQVRWSRRGTIEVSHAGMETAMPGVFAAGDAVSGPATVIEAIGGGKRAADAIDRYLNGIPQPRMPKVPVRHRKEPPLEMSADRKMTLRRPVMPMLNADRRRITFQQVELGYDEESVRKEAGRCLRCDICRRCGLCVEICRDKMGINALRLSYMDPDHSSATDFREVRKACITCGACAANCENRAMVLEEKDGMRNLTLCGTRLNSQAIQYCGQCRAPLLSAEHLAYISKKTDNMIKINRDQLLCADCQRRLSADASALLGPARQP